jgi:hypothetical protein
LTAPSTVPSSSVYYRYRGADGRIVIVDSASQLPSGERDRAERIEFGHSSDGTTTATATALARRLDWPSFAAGFGVALVFAAIVLVLRRGSLRWLGFLAVLGLLVGGFGAYLGFLRRSVGQSTEIFASPSAMIDDARRAVEAVKKKERERDRVIEETQHEGK